MVNIGLLLATCNIAREKGYTVIIIEIKMNTVLIILFEF